MNELTNAVSGSYTPEQALIIYKWNNNGYYIESHPIINGKMGEGIPLEQDTIASMVEYFSSEHDKNSVITGPTPANLLYCEWGTAKKTLVWYDTPQERAMHFTDDLRITDGTAWQPTVIYALLDGHLDIFALKTKGRPAGKDILYQPPYHNCNSRGSVCLGSAKVSRPKVNTYAAWIGWAERMFWGSEFSHLAGGDSPIKGNINTYWNKAIKSRKPFDTSILLPASPKMNLDTFFKKLAK